MGFDQTNDAYASQALTGYGAALEVGMDDGSPETFVAVAEILSISPGAMTTSVLDRTHLRSPEAHREKAAGIRDTGPFTITGNWRPSDSTQSNNNGGSPAGEGSPADSDGLVFLARTRAIRNWRIILPDANQTQWPFRGFVSSFHPSEITVDGILKFTAEITPTQDVSASLP